MSSATAPFVPRLNQIALSVVDLRLTERWFREGLGFLPAGGSRLAMRAPLASRIQGLPRAASTCWWLADRNEVFQLELFQFDRPLAKLMPAEFRPCDVGYTRIGVWVADFDASLRRLEALGTSPLTPALGQRGTRRICVRSPDGVFVELLEHDLLSAESASTRRDCGVAVRSITLSVQDLEQTASFIERGLGLRAAQVSLHTPEHEALWGLAGARTQTRTFVAGDVLVEAVQYLSPRPQPWPEGYRISDQGILNIAFGARNRQDFTETYDRCVAAGARPNCPPKHMPGAGVVYVNDAQGFSFELLWTKPGLADRMWGFEPRPLARRPAPDTQTIEERVCIAAPVETTWAIVADHERMASWVGFDRVTITRAGTPDRNGYGAVRQMQGRPGSVQEEVLAWNPPHGYRYRVTHGSPFVCHQGEVRLQPVGTATELVWTIRFRPRIPGTGPLLCRILGSALRKALGERLKPLVERGRCQSVAARRARCSIRLFNRRNAESDSMTELHASSRRVASRSNLTAAPDVTRDPLTTRSKENPNTMKPAFTSRQIAVNGVTLNVIVEGKGPDVLLAHGFPDCHDVWRHQIPALVEAGYRVIAPDMRGSGLSDAPAATRDYKMGHLVADLVGLLDALEIKKVRLVGHDHGALIGFELCTTHPDRVDRFVAMSNGHPAAYALGPIEQKVKGWYVLFLQIRGLSDWTLRAGDWWLFRTLSGFPEESRNWIEQLQRPGRLAARLNFYRANLGLIVPKPWSKVSKVSVPVMGIFSDGDRFLAEAQMTGSQKFIDAPWRYERIEGANHWLQLDAPEKVNPLLLDYLR